MFEQHKGGSLKSKFLSLPWLSLLFLSAILAPAHAETASSFRQPSTVSATQNPLVAMYTLQPAVPATVSVEFGMTLAYGQRTAELATTGNSVSIPVAGMRQNTTYHMRARLRLANGAAIEDSDHTFTTGSFDPSTLPRIIATTAAGAHPQSGVEMVNPALSSIPNFLQAFVSDLAGNIIWGYAYPDRDAKSIIQPIKLLANGHLGMLISYPSQYAFTPAEQSKLNLVREIDLTGATIRQLTLADLNQRLAQAGSLLTLLDLHHDFIVLPNGHWIVIANTAKNFTNLPGRPGVTQVLGDVLVDLDPNWKPVWIWNEFDHLDVNRHPMNFPDWTHTNAVLYTQPDGNLLVSIRHQNWLVKVDYRNGAGSGAILWRLGNEGDFRLQNGTSPTDWFYAEHNPTFQSDATSGNFTLSFMDNGDDRAFPPGVQCDKAPGPPCHYTTIPVFQIDESAKTATLLLHHILPPAQYSFWGGANTRLANGDIEFDLCSQADHAAQVQEMTKTDPMRPVWQMIIANEDVYRANRIPSLYPGVQQQ